ncbi:MAG TPA: carbon storage regulator [Pirellulales bacterium]|nr:carbon storage regulator [Pirellulales bacterium]
MLVVSRQKDQSIIIGEGGDAVRIVVVEVRGNRVKLAVEAPRDVAIRRDNRTREEWQAGEEPAP